VVSDNYVSLHTHSEHSQLDGFSQVEAIVQRAALLGQSAVALTDHQECSGHIELEKAAKKAGIKPIFGMEGYVVDSIDQTKAEKSRLNSHLCVFAENNQGLTNLWSLSSMAYLKGFYYRALSDWDMLREYRNGLIVTDGCLLANMARFIIEEKEDQALLWASKYLDIFGENNFFMELHTWQYLKPQTDEQKQLNENMHAVNLGKVNIANRLGIPLIVVNDAHYANEEDWENHALFWPLSTKSDDLDKMDNGQTAAWMMNSEEVIYWMSMHGVSASITQEAIANTALIADRCNVEIERKLHVPVLTKSKEEDLQLFLDNIEKGFKDKIVDKGLDVSLYQERIERECELIIERDLPGYFNIVSDYCQELKNRGFLLAAGRGSAGGSLITYLMNINELDPVARGLLFERFLNKGRMDYPDIDTDIPKSKRQEAIGYVESKYGADKVCRIGTFGRLKPKQVLADLCRVMKIEFSDARAMSKIIEQVDDFDEDDENGATQTWEEILETQEGDLTPWFKKYPELFIRMQNMIGLIRQSGTHASGIIISDESLIGQIPVRIKKDIMTTQFDMYTLADMGYIKFDFLGVRNLDTLMEARILVTGQQKCDPRFYYDFGSAEYGDPAIWEPINRGETIGVFQVNTPAGTQLAKKLKPQDEYQIATLISVDRPGIARAGMTDEYVERSKGLRDITTPHPLMTDILQDTYGIVVYQEQVLEIVRELARYSLEEADKIRSIVGKKKMDKMLEEKPRFIQRCIDNPDFIRLASGRAAQKAGQAWDQIEQSGAYAFNKSHALGYSLLACWGAWMKHYYPLEYLTACLMTDPDNLIIYVRELKRKGFHILPPDINSSNERFTIVNGAVRYGLQDLKWVGEAAVKQIRKYRPFHSLEEFLSKVDGRACNKRVVETMIKIGAFDNLGSRHALLYDYYQTPMRKKDKEPNIIPNFQSPDVLQQIELRLSATIFSRKTH
jgi:DNA polymerase-3 subunit alpha